LKSGGSLRVRWSISACPGVGDATAKSSASGQCFSESAWMCETNCEPTRPTLIFLLMESDRVYVPEASDEYRSAAFRLQYSARRQHHNPISNWGAATKKRPETPL